jgi:hypothetical protein
MIESLTTPRHAASHPSYAIVHRFWEEGTTCLAGEEAVAAWYEVGEWWVQLRLPLALLLLFDHLGKHRWVAQSAAQIESAMRHDPFYVRHAAKSRTSKKLTRRVSRAGIKVYVARIREALQLAFDEAGVDLKATDVLVSERTVSNVAMYRLHAKVRWIHLP